MNRKGTRNGNRKCHPPAQGHVLSSPIHSHYQWTVSKHAEPPSRRLQSKVFRHGNDSGKLLQISLAFKSNRLLAGIKKYNLSAIIKNETNNLRPEDFGTRPKLWEFPGSKLSWRFFTPKIPGSGGQYIPRMETLRLTCSSTWLMWTNVLLFEQSSTN